MQDSILPRLAATGAAQLGATGGLGSLGQPAPSCRRKSLRAPEGWRTTPDPGTGSSVDGQFPFEMAFDEPAILQDQPVRPTLQDFVRETQRVIELFTPVF